MPFYRVLSRLFPNSFTAKIVAVMLVGAGGPMLLLALHGVGSGPIQPWIVAATLVAGAATLAGLRALVAPVHAVEAAMRKFETDGGLPDLPTGFTDVAGQLMARSDRLMRRVAERTGGRPQPDEHDVLTGALNRRGFEARVGAMDLSGGALLLADLDGFRQISDRLGHAGGDGILADVAIALRETLRRDDVLGRIGIDVFAIYLSGVGAQAAEGAADRLRRSVEEGVIGGGVPVTISVGMSMPGPERTLAPRLDEAGRNLRAAKTAGRNCVIWSGSRTA